MLRWGGIKPIGVQGNGRMELRGHIHMYAFTISVSVHVRLGMGTTPGNVLHRPGAFSSVDGVPVL